MAAIVTRKTCKVELLYLCQYSLITTGVLQDSLKSTFRLSLVLADKLSAFITNNSYICTHSNSPIVTPGNIVLLHCTSHFLRLDLVSLKSDIPKLSFQISYAPSRHGGVNAMHE